MYTKLLATAAALLFTGSCSAQLVDRGNYLYDPLQNLDWLNIDATRNNSFSTVISRTADAGDLFGWRLASHHEVLTMFLEVVEPRTFLGANHCSEAECLVGNSIQNLPTNSWVTPMFNAFGVSEYGPPMNSYDTEWRVINLNGLTENPNDTVMISNYLYALDGGVLYEGIQFSNPELQHQSAFLVRSPVPEPGSLALITIGVLMLSAAIRRR